MLHLESLDEKVLVAVLGELLVSYFSCTVKKGLLKSGAGQHRGAGEQAASAEFISGDIFLGLEQKGKRCWKEQKL